MCQQFKEHVRYEWQRLEGADVALKAADDGYVVLEVLFHRYLILCDVGLYEEGGVYSEICRPIKFADLLVCERSEIEGD